MSREHVKRRRKKIFEELSKKDTVQISELTNLFDVSNETLRKDLIEMERQGILLRRHGSVVMACDDEEQTLDIRQHDQLMAKERIARAALAYIPTDRAAIGLDSGNTVWCLAKLLAERNGQMIATNSFDVIKLFADKSSENEVYCMGGEMRFMDRAFYGQWALNCINSMGMSVAVLGTAGVKNRDGIGAISFDDADVKHALVKNSALSLALLDSSKFEKNSLLEGVAWEEIDVVITDSNIRDDDRERVEKKTKLLVV